MSGIPGNENRVWARMDDGRMALMPLSSYHSPRPAPVLNAPPLLVRHCARPLFDGLPVDHGDDHDHDHDHDMPIFAGGVPLPSGGAFAFSPLGGPPSVHRTASGELKQYIESEEFPVRG